MDASTASPEPPAGGDRRERLVADLRHAGCVFAEDEADLAVAALFAEGVDPVGGEARLEDYVRRRAAGEPAEYILGSAVLAGRRVKVGPGVFIPRPWSADLVARAAQLLNIAGDGTAVDLGTGSGAIALAISELAPRSHVWATEVDAEAVRWAMENCADRPGVTVCQGDLYEGLPVSLRHRVDVIAGSLPYVPSGEMDGLPRDHVTNEPVQAFDGGETGLAVISRALNRAREWLRPGGHILMEIGAGEGPPATALAAAAGLADVVVHTDGGGGELFLEAAARDLNSPSNTKSGGGRG